MAEDSYNGRLQVNAQISHDVYVNWKKTGMKASKVFEFGLKYGELTLSLKRLEDQIVKLGKIRDKLQNLLLQREDEITMLKRQMELDKENRT